MLDWCRKKSHAIHPVLFKGLVLYNKYAQKEHVSLQITVPPGGQTVLFPQSQNVFSYYLHLSVSFFPVIFGRCPQKAIYLFPLWLYDVLMGKAVTVQHVSSSVRKKRERTHRLLHLIALRQYCQRALSWWKSIRSSVLFTKEYFYCYFVVTRRECINLDCIVSGELSGRFSSFKSTNGKKLTAWLEKSFFYLFRNHTLLVIWAHSTFSNWAFKACNESSPNTRRSVIRLNFMFAVNVFGDPSSAKNLRKPFRTELRQMSGRKRERIMFQIWNNANKPHGHLSPWSEVVLLSKTHGARRDREGNPWNLWRYSCPKRMITL